MDWIRRDLLQSLRALCRQPGFTIVVILTTALGIGTTTAVFSLFYSILIKPFPYREPDRLVRVQSRYTKQGGALKGCSLLDVEDYRRRATTLVDLGAYTTFDSQLIGDGPAQIVAMSQLNPGALSILGVEPVIGRLLNAAEDIPGGDVHKALISYQLWQSRFNLDPAIVGKAIRTDRLAYTIVGVMPPGFAFPDRTGIWTPMESFYATMDADRRIKRRESRWYNTIARLKPGATLEQAEADLNSVAAGLEREYPRENDGIRVKLTPLRDFEVGNVRPYLFLLLAGVGFVLLVCCANVANLLLARSAVRARELTVRTSLGAGRFQLIRQVLTESLLLGLAGGALGISIAYGGLRALLALIPVTLPFWMKIEIDSGVLVFSLALALLTGILFGLAPAIVSSRVDLSRLLREGARGSSAGGRFRSTLVVAEVALSLLLLVGAGLLMRTFIGLQRIDAGFQSEGVLTARIVKYAAGTRKEAAAVLYNFHERLLGNLRRIPGVLSAAVTNSLPYAGTQSERTQADIGIKGRASEETKLLAPLSGADVSVDYFRTMRIPLLKGRYFDASDTESSPFVVLINERGAKMFWPNQDPIGQEILWGQLTATNPYCRIVGVVGNVKHQAAEADNGVELYYPLSQWPVMNSYYVVRTQGDPENLVSAIRAAIHGTDHNASIDYIKTMERTIDESLWQRRLWSVLFGVFAVLALLLAAVGLYGVMSYSVTQRTREIGIRMALGAQPQGVLGMVLRRGMLLVGAGMLIGAGAALTLTRLIAGLLFGVSAFDPATYAAVAGVLVAVSFLACSIPAIRASRVDPQIALREE
jgi:putative ABC transport system permease protein